VVQASTELSVGDRSGPARTIERVPKKQIVTENVANAAILTVWSISSAPIGMRDLVNPPPRPRRIGHRDERSGPVGDHFSDLCFRR